MRIFVFMLLFLPGVIFAQVPGNSHKTGVLRVFADTSLVGVLADISSAYSPRHGLTFSTTFDSPNELMRRIEEGEAADVVIVNDRHFLERLKQKGLVDISSVQKLGSDRLVLALSEKSILFSRLPRDRSVKNLLPWLMGRTFLVLPDPETDPLGAYIGQIFTNLGLSLANAKVTQAVNSQEALYMAEENNAAGIFYASTLPDYGTLRQLAAIPDNLYEPLEIYAAVLAGENVREARALMAYLRSEKGLAVFHKHGL